MSFSKVPLTRSSLSFLKSSLHSRIGIRTLSSSNHHQFWDGFSTSSGTKDLKITAFGLAFGAAIVSLATSRKESDVTLTESVKGAEENYRTRPEQKYPSPPEVKSHPIDHINDPPKRDDLPIIPLEEVGQHCDEDSMWFTFRGAVYDLTFFKNGHPGGTPRLLMAAGQDLEAYWEVYRQHLRGHIVDWMEKHRIGSLSADDIAKVEANRLDFGDMYETDPIRDPNLLGCTQKPWCGEPRIDLLTKDYITPVSS